LSEPNFFIAGIPKCGTTALFDYLSQHPNVWCPPVKEPNFYASDYPALQGPADEAGYLRLFADAGPQHTARGEASVLYFYSRVAVPAILERFPAARFIVMLRNPVDMVYSFHSQMLATLNEDEADFRRAWALQDERAAGRRLPSRCLAPDLLQYGDVGRFSARLERLQGLIPSDRLHLVWYDDLRDDPAAVFDTVTDFLELPRYAGIDFRVVNPNKIQRSRLVAGMTERPVSPGLRRMVGGVKRALGIGSLGLRRRLARLNTTERRRPPLAADFRAELRDYFAADIAALESLTGRDLTAWRT
jgi:hypothetical protein